MQQLRLCLDETRHKLNTNKNGFVINLLLFSFFCYAMPFCYLPLFYELSNYFFLVGNKSPSSYSVS